ncbi:hypothetical protein BaRGS_00016571 [Batillaria attramentaria]|uniref:Uncharacterized protein n=1 Tax=Batillaria attramentaria TaxID=370345 RepID=A0ABD0KYL6_9CAEN
MYEQPGTVRLYTEWPGIPKSISEIIQLFTETCPKRPGLWDAKEKLEIIRKTADEKALAEREGNSVSLWESALGNGRKYPTVSSSQKERRHIPETGIPHSVKQLIYTEHGRYRNVGKDVHYPPESNAVTDIELSCSDLMTVNHENGRTVVKEVVTPGFVKDVLPSLEACSLPCVTCWGPQITHDDVTQPEAVIHLMLESSEESCFTDQCLRHSSETKPNRQLRCDWGGSGARVWCEWGVSKL